MESSGSIEFSLSDLERDLNGRLGLYALNTGNGAEMNFHAQERFPMCSTFKILLVAAILDKSISAPELLQQIINYSKADLVPYSPVTEKHFEKGLSIADLCAAALQVSDNTAANLLIEIIGDPSLVTHYARSIGDQEFRLDRMEPDLNSAAPGDTRDTTTPKAMAWSLQRLVLGDVLPSYQKKLLCDWMLSNTTGASRIRAGVPEGWRVADKTGTGFYGAANDIAVVWPPGQAPLLMAIYTLRSEKNAAIRNDILAAAARILVKGFF